MDDRAGKAAEEGVRAPVSRRVFLAESAAATALTIVPRRVLGGSGHLAPSDMIVLAQVGCGTQAQRQVDTGLVARKDLQFVAVVDPNRDSQNYLDWEEWGNRERIRRFLDEPTWGEGDTGIRAGRDVARLILETYYRKQGRPAAGIRAYEDYREMLDKETDVQGIVNITPDHQHGSINVSALRKGRAAISHKPVASVLHEVRRTVEAARASAAASHLLAYSNTPDRHTLAAWIKAGVIGTVREVHNWTNRPFWPQGWQEYYRSGPPVPGGFNWELWQGPEPDRPYHPNYTFVVYRGWYAYGAGCLGDMGFYSLWQPYRILDLGVPELVEARPNNEAFVSDKNVSDGGHVSLVGFPKASTIRWRHPATASRPSVDTFWYDGGMKPQTPEELYADDEDLASEGMLFVGDQGKILCDFRANKPRLVPRSRQRAFEGSVAVPEFDATTAEEEWINALRNGTRSRGSFEQVEALAEAVTLGNIALRVPYKRLRWDAQRMEFTNSAEATRLVRREQYRAGWEQLFD
ncbi:MAG TPA: Gfo/Idh/MocA family oxidoreductase [Vicinamibacteria bacterium]|nr:Gfo/Idh/MocA family oxidoreductase [Vicinamibacteria bacterium]